MNSDKNIALHKANDPVTDVDFTGTSINNIEMDDDPITDVDVTGTSISSIEPDDFVYTQGDGNRIDLQCEGEEFDPMFAFSSVSYQDPLGDVELGDADDTGICLHYLDTDLDDLETDVDFTGSSIIHMGE